MRKAIAVAAMVAGLVGLGGEAFAHTKAFPREITASLNGTNRIDGDLDSPKAKCFAGARLDLRDEDGVGGIVDTEFANLQGEFSFENVPTGVYRVVAPKRVLSNTAEHRHTCKKVMTETGILVA
jgi:hypothetical protein